MSEPRDDLRATEESVRRDAAEVERLERAKADLDPADERVEELSEEIERVARTMHGKSTAELELSREIRPDKR